MTAAYVLAGELGGAGQHDETPLVEHLIHRNAVP